MKRICVALGLIIAMIAVLLRFTRKRRRDANLSESSSVAPAAAPPTDTTSAASSSARVSQASRKATYSRFLGIASFAGAMVLGGLLIWHFDGWRLRPFHEAVIRFAVLAPSDTVFNKPPLVTYSGTDCCGAIGVGLRAVRLHGVVRIVLSDVQPQTCHADDGTIVDEKTLGADAQNVTEHFETARTLYAITLQPIKRPKFIQIKCLLKERPALQSFSDRSVVLSEIVDNQLLDLARRFSMISGPVVASVLVPNHATNIAFTAATFLQHGLYANIYHAAVLDSASPILRATWSQAESQDVLAYWFMGLGVLVAFALSRLSAPPHQ